MIIHTYDFKLIYRFENVVFRLFKVNQFNKNILLSSIFTVEDKAVTKHFVDGLISFVQSAGSVAEHKDYTLNLARCNAIFGITRVEVLLEIISK